MQISFQEPQIGVVDAQVVVVADGTVLSPAAEAQDKASNGSLSKGAAASRFNGKSGEFLDLLALAGASATRLVLAGVGKPAEATPRGWQDWGGRLYKHLAGSGATSVAIAVEAVDGPVTATDAAANVAFGITLAAYRFDRYRTTEKADQKPTVTSVTVQVAGAGEAEAAYAPLSEIAAGVNFARDLVSEPGNVIYPETLAAQCEKLRAQGVDVEVMDEAKLEQIGMRTLLAVGMGSERESRVVVMRWMGADDASTAPLALIGKGVTFDTGGISIKPAGGMEDMKFDMGGSAAVIGAMRAIAGRKAKANVIGIVGLVENMPSHNAQRPGDVVTSLSGQTVEVINTDAEGRLVLCDLITYMQQTYKPVAMVDLATLTGAIIVSLGHHYGGLFSNDDALSASLTTAGQSVGEGLWRMPMGEEYDKAIESDIADMKNVGGRDGGSITAAQFLLRFVEGDTPWAHLDIAGMAWAKQGKPTVPKGAVGFGVRLLDQLVADQYEQA
jgi:leucyl aminopeptidase